MAIPNIGVNNTLVAGIQERSQNMQEWYDEICAKFPTVMDHDTGEEVPPGGEIHPDDLSIRYPPAGIFSFSFFFSRIVSFRI